MEELEKDFLKIGYKKTLDNKNLLIYKNITTCFGKNGIICNKNLVNKEFDIIKVLIFKKQNKRLFLRKNIVTKDNKYRVLEPFSLDLELLDLVKKQADLLNF